MSNDNDNAGAATLILVSDVAGRIGKDRSTVLRRAKRMGMGLHSVQGPRGATSAALSAEDAARLQEHYDGGLRPLSGPDDDDDHDGGGVYYVVRLVPELDPRRVKFGFTTSLDRRLAEFRTTCPHVELVRQWPCSGLNVEHVATGALARRCRHLGGEVFEADDIDDVLEAADAFFALCNHQPATTEGQ